MGKKRGLEKKSNEERLNGIEDGTRLGESEERGRWLAEGHGPGLCSKPYDERRKGHEEGIEEGKNLGREEGFWLAKNAFDKIIHAVKTKEQANDSLQRMSETTQTTTPTADAVTKTTPNDKPPRLLNAAGTPTGQRRATTITEKRRDVNRLPPLVSNHPQHRRYRSPTDNGYQNCSLCRNPATNT